MRDRTSELEVADLLETIVYLDEARALGLNALVERARRCDPEIERIDYPLRLLSLRQQVLGDAYPFLVTGSAVGRRLSHRTASCYIDLLAMSPRTLMRSRMSQSAIADCAACFEKVCSVALERLLGPGSRALRFAWPSDCGRPPEFPAAVAWLAEQMGLRLGRGFVPPRRKDGGVDVIAWRAFGDGRTGFPVYLGQCTVQHHIRQKCDDIDIDSWSRWLELLRDPVTALMTPAVIDGSGELWIELALRNIVLDRIRIAKLLADSSALSDMQRSDTVDCWFSAAHEWLSDR